MDNEKPKEKSESESSDSEDFDATEEYQTRLRDEATYEKERVSLLFYWIKCVLLILFCREINL